MFKEKNYCHRCGIPRNRAAGSFRPDYKGDVYCSKCAREMNLNQKPEQVYREKASRTLFEFFTGMEGKPNAR